ncbi:hypothetical protein LXL04_018920 [Taraxacum kok-saghyz]
MELDKSYECSDFNGVKRKNWSKESRVGTEQKRTTNLEKFVNHEREETKSRIRQRGRRRWQAVNVDVYQNRRWNKCLEDISNRILSVLWKLEEVGTGC